jgi:flagellar motility protein MotE (MotC chaperone)
MNRDRLARFLGLIFLAFVKLRVLQVLMVCAVLLIFVRLERLYNISDDIFVNAASAQQKAESPAVATAPAPPKPEEAKVMPAEKPTAEAKKDAFPSDQKPKKGFKAEGFDILQLSAEQVEVLRTLSKRHRDLVQRERSISEREATLLAIEQRMDKKTAELKKIQGFLEQLLSQKGEKEKEAIKKLVVVYEKMKPIEAASILQELDLDTLLSILDEMKDGKVSAIFAKMEPLRARILTTELSQRRKKLEEKMKDEHEASADQAKLIPAVAPAPVDASKPAAPDVGKPALEPQPLPDKVVKPVADAPKIDKPNKSQPTVAMPIMPKVEKPKAVAAKSDASKLESPKMNASMPETPMLAAPKTGDFKSEKPKSELPKVVADMLAKPKPDGVKPESDKLEVTKETRKSDSADLDSHTEANAEGQASGKY